MAGNAMILRLRENANSAIQLATTGDTIQLQRQVNGSWQTMWVQSSNDFQKHFPTGDYLMLQVPGNIGKTEIFKNSSTTADYGTCIRNWMGDGRTELTINDAEITVSKIDAGGAVIKKIVLATF